MEIYIRLSRQLVPILSLVIFDTAKWLEELFQGASHDGNVLEKWKYIRLSRQLVPILSVVIFDTAKWIWDSSIFSSIKPKLDIGLFFDFCVFTYLFLPAFAWCEHKIVLFWFAEQLNDHIMQNLVKTGKKTEINKQSHVKFWLNWIKYGALIFIKL